MDRNHLSLRSVRDGYGPQGVWLTVRKPVAGNRKWTAACSASSTALFRWYSNSGA
ncbi:hypothetical protein Hanom_Chr03g00184991 [Helianthus anomalus]